MASLTGPNQKVLKVNARLELQLRNTPTYYADLMTALEIVKDYYKGLSKDKPFAYFFYILCGFTCKFKKNFGSLKLYVGEIKGSFLFDAGSSFPEIPCTMSLHGDDGGIAPDLIFSFFLEIEETNMAGSSLIQYVIKRSPGKYKRRNSLKLSLFVPYGIKVKSQKTLKITMDSKN